MKKEIKDIKDRYKKLNILDTLGLSQAKSDINILLNETNKLTLALKRISVKTDDGDIFQIAYKAIKGK